MRKKTRNFVSAALFLVILTAMGMGCSKSGTSLTTTPVTYLTLINEATYTGPATVYLNDTLATEATGIAPGSYSSKYGTIRPGYYDVKFTTASADSLLSEIPSSDYDTLNFYTLILYNNYHGGGAVQSTKILDDFSKISTISANYRFFNLSPDEPNVDVFLNNTIVQSSRTTADNVPNTLYNAFGQTAAGLYTITIKSAGKDSVIASVQNVDLTNGNAYTIFLSGNINSNVTPLQINVLQATY